MCRLPEIEKMKSESHPMEAKKDLARRIVTDFHSADAAAKAAEDWAKQFQKDEVPEDVEEVEASVEVTADGRVRLDKLLAAIGLAESVSDAVRKLKQNAVKVNGEVKLTRRLAGSEAIRSCCRSEERLRKFVRTLRAERPTAHSSCRAKQIVPNNCHPERSKPIRLRIGL